MIINVTALISFFSFFPLQSEKAENKDAENEKSTCEFQKIHAKVRAKMEVQ